MLRAVAVVCAVLLSFQVKPVPSSPIPGQQMARVLNAGTIRATSKDPGYLAASLYGQTPMGIELEPGPVVLPGQAVFEIKKGEKFGDLIWKITFKFPSYHPAGRFGVITIAPPDLLTISPFESRLPGYQVTDVTLREAVTTLRHLMDSSYAGTPDIERPANSPTAPIDDLLKQRVTLALGPASAREVLNSLILKVPQFTWVVSYAHAPPTIEGATITLVALKGGLAVWGSRK